MNVKRKYNNRKPWLSEAFKTTIKYKNTLYKKCKHIKSAFCEEYYKQYKRKLQQLMKVAEKKYHHDLIIKYKHDMKRWWGLIKDMVNRNKKLAHQTKFRIGNDDSATDKNIISNKFNDFYINVGPTLACVIPISNNKPSHFLAQSFSKLCFWHQWPRRKLTSKLNHWKILQLAMMTSMRCR